MTHHNCCCSDFRLPISLPRLLGFPASEFTTIWSGLPVKTPLTDRFVTEWKSSGKSTPGPIITKEKETLLECEYNDFFLLFTEQLFFLTIVIFCSATIGIMHNPFTYSVEKKIEKYANPSYFLNPFQFSTLSTLLTDFHRKNRTIL